MRVSGSCMRRKWSARKSQSLNPFDYKLYLTLLTCKINKWTSASVFLSFTTMVRHHRAMSGTIPSMETLHDDLKDNTIIVGR